MHSFNYALVAITVLHAFTFQSGNSAQELQPVPIDTKQQLVEEVSVAESDSPLQKLVKLRHNAAAKDLNATYASHIVNNRDYSELPTSLRRYLKARLDLTESAADKVQVWEFALKHYVYIEKLASARFAIGRCGPQDVARAEFDRLDAELELTRARDLSSRQK